MKIPCDEIVKNGTVCCNEAKWFIKTPMGRHNVCGKHKNSREANGHTVFNIKEAP